MTENKYKKTEIEIRNIVQAIRNGKTSLYELATKCRSLLSDSDNYAEAIGISPNRVLPHLNEYWKDFAVDLETILELLKLFPERSQWNRPLLELLYEGRRSHAAAAAASRQENAPIRVRRTATIAQLDEVAKVVEEKQLEIDRLKSQATVPLPTPESAPPSLARTVIANPNELAELRQENRRLAIENKNLRRELAQARAEVRRLSKLKRELARV